MTDAQRTRMMSRFFHKCYNEMGIDRLEKRIAFVVLMALGYGGSVRTINRIVRDIRANHHHA